MNNKKWKTSFLVICIIGIAVSFIVAFRLKDGLVNKTIVSTTDIEEINSYNVSFTEALDLNNTNLTKEQIILTQREKTIGEALLQFKWIDKATVTLDLNENKNNAYVDLSTNEELNNDDIAKIALYVSKCVNNLDIENIEIKDESGNIIFSESGL